MPPNGSDPQHPSNTGHSVSTDKSARVTGARKAAVVLGLVALLVVFGVVIHLIDSHNKTSTNTANTNASAKLPVAEVSITSSAFVPSTINIKVGEAVTWTNADSAAHWVASDPYPADNGLAGFNSGQGMLTNDTFTFVFSKAGTYSYHDNLNPYTIKGVVVVKS